MPTTTTFYADNVSGHRGIQNQDSLASWATIHDASAGSGVNTGDHQVMTVQNVGSPSGYRIKRAYFAFDTSSIPDAVTITAATFRVRNTGAYPYSTGTVRTALVQVSPASPTSLVVGDYDQFGTTIADEHSFDVSNEHGAYSLASYLSWVSKTGYTQLGIRNYQFDTLNNAPGSGVGVELFIAAPDNATVDYRPQLTVTYWGTDRYWVGGNGNWSDTNHWSDTSGGTAGAPVPTSANDVYIDANSGFSAAGGTISLDIHAACKAFNTTGVTNSPTLTGNPDFGFSVTGTPTISGIFWTFSGMTIFSAGGTFTSNGVSFGGAIVFSSNPWTLGDALTIPGTLGMNSSTLDFNGKAVACGTFLFLGSGARTLTMGSSTVTITGAGTGGWDASNNTNLTINAGTSTIVIGTSGGVFHGGGKTYNNVTLQSATTTITGSNTFATLTFTAGKTVIGTSGTTQTVTSLVATGSAGNLITIRSTVSGSVWTISDSAGTNTCDYLDLKDNTASGGATFNPGDNSVDSGNNSGWTQPWTNPTNAYSSNNVYATHTSPTGKLYVQLSKDGGTTWQTALLKTYTGAEGAQTYGDGATEKWGTSFTGDDMDDASFKLRIIADSSTSFNRQTYGSFGFDALIAGARILTGVEVSVEAKWDGTTLSVDHIKVQGHSGTSTFSVTQGALAYATDKDTVAKYDGNNWFGLIPEHGWIGIAGTFTYASATTINVSAGAASIYNIGDKLRFQNNDSGTYLYAYINNVADTLLTVQGDAVPNATLTDKYYSKMKNPQNFPDNIIGNTLGYAEATTGQTVTTLADLTSLSVTVVVPTGKRYIRISCYVQGTSTDGPRNIDININESSTQLQTERIQVYGAGAVVSFMPSVILIPTAGSHTYKLQGTANGGTFTLSAGSTHPNYILVELL